MTDNALKISKGANMDSLTIIKDELRWLTAIAEAENDADLQAATKALSVAVEILNGVSLFKDANRNIYDCAESMSVDAEFGLKDIANILSGGKPREYTSQAITSRKDGK